MKKFILVVLSIILIIFAFPEKHVLAQSDNFSISTSAKSMILIEKDSGRVLLEKNADEQLSIASTTKILTALTVLENCLDIKKVVTINKNSVGIEGTSIYLKDGEKLTIEDLLYGLMLRSGNDAATALAYEIGGSIENFCNLMNDTAKKYGATNSNFANPHGLDYGDHHCSARDLAMITKGALKNCEFAKIVSTKTYRVEQRENSIQRLFQNKNKLLYRLDGANGVKTGYTKKAGRCLVSSCERNGMTLICVVLNCGPMWEDSEKLFEYGFSNYSKKEILPPYFVCNKCDVINGEKEQIDLFCIKGFSYPLTEEEFVRIRIDFDYPNSLNAPIEKEKIVGNVRVILDNDLLFDEKIYTMEQVKSILVKEGLRDFIKNWFGK